MLAQTDLSLSKIAYATGFSDQSHLARHFRHMLGTTPREFRWSQRQRTGSKVSAKACPATPLRSEPAGYSDISCQIADPQEASCRMSTICA
jgi:hypothetical protein